MAPPDLTAVIDRAVTHGARVQARAGRPRLLDEATIRRAHASHLTGVNLTCLARHYGVSRSYMGQRFHELGLPVFNYSDRRVRAAALAAED
jgi:hypothetical protein